VVQLTVQLIKKNGWWAVEAARLVGIYAQQQGQMQQRQQRWRQNYNNAPST
jgi:hypothetical protein